MRFIVILAVAAILTPAALDRAPGRVRARRPRQASDLSRRRKRRKSAEAKPKEEYLKAAPGTGRAARRT